MGALPEREQMALIRNCRHELTQALKSLEADAAAHKNGSDKFLYLAYRGAVTTMRSRLALLTEAERIAASDTRKKP
jgi:hypothetical protein